MATTASRHAEGDGLEDHIHQPTRKHLDTGEKSTTLKVQESRTGLQERLRSFKKVYGATASQHEKQRLLQHFKERKERASSIENGGPVCSRSSPTALSKQRSFVTSSSRPTTGKGGGIRTGGSSWDSLPKRPQTALGFARGASRSLEEDQKHVPWQDDGRFSSWSWDSGTLGAVSSLAVSSKAVSVRSHAETGDSAEIMPSTEQNLESRGAKTSLMHDDAAEPQGNSPKQQEAAVSTGAVDLSGCSQEAKDRGGNIRLSCGTTSRQSKSSADCSTALESTYLAVEASAQRIEPGAASETNLVLAAANGRPGYSPTSATKPLLNEAQLESASSSLDPSAAGVIRASVAVPEQDDSTCNSPVSSSSPLDFHPNWATELRVSGQPLAVCRSSGSLHGRMRPSTSIPSLRYSGLSSSASLSADHWSPQSRPSRAFSAPSSRSSSPLKLREAPRLEVRTRVAFSYQQFALFEDGVPVQRERMISRPEPSKTTVQQLQEWRQSERVQAWWYHHQKTVFQQRKMRLKKAALDVRWIQERRRREKAWHRAMTEEATRRALAAERLKRAFRSVLTMVKARLRSPAIQAAFPSDEQFFKGLVTEQQRPPGSGGSPPRNLREPTRAGARGSRASGEAPHRKSEEERSPAGGGAAGPLPAAPERRRCSAEGPTPGQDGAAPADATRPASVSNASDSGAGLGNEAGSGGGVGEAVSASATRAIRASTTGERGPAGGKKKSVAFGGVGGRGNENQRPKPGRPGRPAGRGTKDARSDDMPWQSTAEDEPKGAGKAAWLVPVYKSNNFVPMFHVPQEGPLLTSRRLWGSTGLGSNQSGRADAGAPSTS